MPNDKLNLSLDEELVTYRRRRSRTDRKAPYFICGLGGANRHGESMNVVEVLAGLSPAAIKLFSAMLKTRVVESNLVLREQLVKNGVDSRSVDNHMPLLMAVDLVRRISRGVYMINPMAVMPPNGTEARAVFAAAASYLASGKN